MNNEKTTGVVAKTQKNHDLAWWEDDEKLQLIKDTIAVGATDQELQLFLYQAKRTNLDPLIGQVHCVKRGGKMTIQTGIDGYRVVADRTNKLAGIEDAVYESANGMPIKASVTILKFVNNQVCSFTASARWKEYVPNKGQDWMWKKMPFLMIGKCAEALALRKAFPQDLSGIYTDDEMQQADNASTIRVDAKVVEEPKGIDLATKKKQNVADLLQELSVKKLANKVDFEVFSKELTSLDLKECNFDEIYNRLLVIKEEREQSKVNK